MTRISAIIPTYNRAPLVGRAIISVLGQTLTPAEIIVVDDGSTDTTREVVEGFGDRVRYTFQSNAGVAAARNVGAADATSEWLAFLDSDDTWEPDYLRRIVGAIEATGGRADTYFMDLAVEGCEQTVWERSGFEIDAPFEVRDDPAEWFMRSLQPMTTQATVIRREAYWEVGGQRRELPSRQDTHLFFRLGFSGPACAVRGVGAVLGAGAEERLTGVHSPSTLSYCQETIALYEDVRRRHARRLRRTHRRELRHRLAAAHWGHACIEMRERSLGAPVALVSSFFLSPGLLARKLRRART